MIIVERKSLGFHEVILGRCGENNVLQIRINIQSLIDSYGEGNAVLVHQRSQDDVPYLVPIERDGAEIVWTVSSGDTAYPGVGKSEIRWLVGDALAKSIVYKTIVHPSLTGESTPQPSHNWYDMMIDYLNDRTVTDVAVISLPAGSEPTVEYEDGLVTFGIPAGDKGEKGDKGDQGIQGIQGETGNGIASVEKTGTSGGVDTYTITMTDGTTYEFTVTNSEDIGAREEIEQLKNALITDSASGAIASFPDGGDGFPVSDLKVQMEPIQAGSGDPSPDNVRPITGHDSVKVWRTGVNLIDTSDITDYSKWSANIAPSGDMPSNDTNRIYLLPALKSGVQYTISFGVTSASFPKYLYFGYYKDGSATKVAYVTTIDVQRQSISFMAIAGVTYCLRMGATGTEASFNAQIAKLSYIQLELGSTATAYEPYQGQSIEIQLGQTVYGGTLDVTQGVLTVDRAMVDLGTLNWTKQTTYGFYSTGLQTLIKNPSSNSVLPNIVCAAKVTSTWNDLATGGTGTNYISVSSGYLGIADSRDIDSTTFKAAMSGVMLVYELATPITIQLTPQQMTTLLGQNNVWSDAGDTEVEYRADTKLYIEKLTAPTEDDMVADHAISANSFFMVGNNLYRATTAIASGATITVGTNATKLSLSDALNALA